MKIAFYKGSGHSIGNRIAIAGIKLWTFGKYSHVELIDNNGDWYSSDAFKTGVVRKLEQFKHDPDNWDIFDLKESTDCSMEKAIDFVESQYGKKYDWTGIFLCQLLPIGIHITDQWFCSEICHYALVEGGCVGSQKDSRMVSPAGLYRILKHQQKI